MFHDEFNGWQEMFYWFGMAIMKTFAAECVKLDGQVLGVKVVVDDCFRTCGLERFEDYVDASDDVITCVFATASQGRFIA